MQNVSSLYIHRRKFSLCETNKLNVSLRRLMYICACNVKGVLNVTMQIEWLTS